MRKNHLAAPVIKWFGKGPVFDELSSLFPKRITSYCEPFLGSGAALFHLQPDVAYLNDSNPELIQMYETIRDHVEELITVLEGHPNQENHYHLVRNWDRNKRQYGKLSKVQRAARIIYLSRTCYNGLYRVNSAGEFDTPFGHYQNVKVADIPVLRAVSAYFKQARITFSSMDYTGVLSRLTKETFVYFDPPYHMALNVSGNACGGKSGFERSEQIRLRRCCDELDRRGIKFMLSNCGTDFVKEQYAGYNIIKLKARRQDGFRASNSNAAEEIIIKNY